MEEAGSASEMINPKEEFYKLNILMAERKNIKLADGH